MFDWFILKKNPETKHFRIFSNTVHCCCTSVYPLFECSVLMPISFRVACAIYLKNRVRVEK